MSIQSILPSSFLLGDAPSPDNGWEKLLAQLDPIVVDSLEITLWQELEAKVVSWLLNNVSEFSWLNALAISGAILTRSGATYTYMTLGACHSFLRWAIPDHYPDLTAFKVDEALESYFGDPPRPRGTQAYKVYISLQGHTQRYLSTLPQAKRLALTPFLLPTFKSTPRLRKLCRRTQEQSRLTRKKQAFAITDRLPYLVALGRRRYRWLADLEAQIQTVAQSVAAKELSLPLLIKQMDLNGHQEITFRVWDQTSWLCHHRSAYSKTASNAIKGAPFSSLFLQLVGELPEHPWFLRAIEVGALQGMRNPSATVRAYLQQVNAPCLWNGKKTGLLALSKSMGKTLYYARRKAAGGPEDSPVLFCVEPLLAAASVGLFILVSLTSTGMRIGELQQVTLDQHCMEYNQSPQFDDCTQTWIPGPKRLYWNLYPKGATERERYVVPVQVTEALFIMLELHKRYYGQDSIRPVASACGGFSHHQRFPGKHKFVLQWAGRHLPGMALNQCLSFLLLEHGCCDEDGQPVYIVAHLLRHAVAGWLRNQGIPLEDLMALLKQVDISMADYYSQPSPEELYRRLGPALTALADLAGAEPVAVRTVGDIQTLATDALKRYGTLRHTPGGTCAIFTPCEVQFKCASCPTYIPDPARRREVQQKIAAHQKAIQLFDDLGDYLQADTQRACLRDWERVEQEMIALAHIDLLSPPSENSLAELVMDDLVSSGREQIYAGNAI